MSPALGDDRREWLPQQVDTTKPHSARVYDYWLGGKDNYAPDRALGDKILAAIPRQRRHVRANRAFMVRVVEYLAREAGIRQIIDIGAGLPTSPNMHEVAHAIAPETRVVYVDNDPIVMAHARAVMPNVRRETVSYVLGDLRHPASIMDDPALRDMIDLERPCAVLLLAMLMSIPDAARPYDIVAELLETLPSGSFLAITHTTADFNPAAMGEHVQVATAAGMPFTPRSRAEVEQFFDGLELVEPGVVPVVNWRPHVHALTESDGVYIYGGLGRKP
jgi:S-adenosyl methyltransferase